MATRRSYQTRLPAPYLKRICWAHPDAARPSGYPFNLPVLKDPAWDIAFTTPVTILVGENGVGKSTLIEALAAIAGYHEAGGAKGSVCWTSRKARCRPPGRSSSSPYWHGRRIRA